MSSSAPRDAVGAEPPEATEDESIDVHKKLVPWIFDCSAVTD